MIAIPSFLFICPAEKKKIVGSVGETDPHLLAVQNVFIALASRRRARADDVRSGAWLSQSVSRQFLTFGLRHEVSLLLLFCAPRVKRQRIQTRVHRHCDAQ